jgi:hypothetical protein
VAGAKSSLADIFAAIPDTIFDPYQQNYVSGYLNQLDAFKKKAEQDSFYSNYRQGLGNSSIAQQTNPAISSIYSDAQNKYAKDADSAFSGLRSELSKTRETYLNPNRYGSNFDQLPAINPLFPSFEANSARGQLNSLRVRASDLLPNIAGVVNPFAQAKLGAQAPTVSAQTAASSPITGVNVQNPYQPIIPQSNKIFPYFTGASSSNNQSSSFVK